MYTSIFLAARNHFIYTTLRSFEEFWGVLTHDIQTLKCDVVSFGVIARSATTKQSKTQTRNVRLFRSELIISGCVIFYAELRKNTLGGKKYAFNQMLRICRERPLLSLFFIFLSSKIRLFTYQYHNISLTKVNR